MRSPRSADSDCREKYRDGLGRRGRGHMGSPRQRLRVDVLLDPCQLAVSNGRQSGDSVVTRWCSGDLRGDLMQKRIAFIVGHESWGKSETLGQSRTFVRGMSNDDRPTSFIYFMDTTKRPAIIAALCPKFEALNDDSLNKTIDGRFDCFSKGTSTFSSG